MKHLWMWGVAVLLVVTLAGCSGDPSPVPGTGEVPVVTRADAGRVLAEAAVEAAQQRVVSVRNGGTVLELGVAEGDEVAVGDVLLRLDPIDAELAVEQAEASLAQAEAQLARLVAGPREVELAVAEAQLGTTRSVVSQAVAQRDRLYSGTTEAQIAAAEADLAATQAEELVRRIAHERTMECQTDPETGQEICPLLGPTEEQARFAWHAAVARREAAEAALEALDTGATAEVRIANTGVAVARAQESVAEVQLAQLEAGVAAEEIAAARAAVAQAQTARDLARVALARMEVAAPIAGTVTRVMVKAGDQVAPGQIIVHLATLNALQVRTVDLTELDVVRLEVGQVVEVRIDALPELSLIGHVSEIGLEAVNYRGDVTYPVVVVLDEVDPRLRLGMTAEVRIEAP
jgi:multidrug efflux pump subunit AcrA (membrane-fusion protein)